VMFKQFLSSGSIDICQIDACRVAGVNENIATLIMAAKFGIPRLPPRGRVGLCEIVQHFSMFDYVAVSTDIESHWIEFVDHLHEHFVDSGPCGQCAIWRRGPRYLCFNASWVHRGL